MKSSIANNRPELELLKRRVEEKEGFKPSAPSDFLTLTAHINNVINGQLNEYTIMRLWGYLKQYKSIRHSTLDLLSNYVGYSCWDEFLKAEKKNIKQESGEIKRTSIIVKDLSIGSKIKIAWLPDRVTVLEYNGDYKFTIIEVENASWNEGETFYCRSITAGEPLYVDNLMHLNGSTDERYCVGMQNGLTLAEVL